MRVKNTEDKSLIERIKDKIENFLLYNFGYIDDSNFNQTIVRRWDAVYLHIFYYKDKYPFFYFSNYNNRADAEPNHGPKKICVFTENELRGFICYLEEVWKWWHKTYKNDKNDNTRYLSFNKTYKVRTEYLWLYKKVKVHLISRVSTLRLEMNGVWRDFSIRSSHFSKMIDDLKYILNFNQNGKI